MGLFGGAGAAAGGITYSRSSMEQDLDMVDMYYFDVMDGQNSLQLSQLQKIPLFHFVAC